MTDCEDALGALADVMYNKERRLSSSDVSELKNLGLISTVKDPGLKVSVNGNIEITKNRLMEGARRKEELKVELRKRERAEPKKSPRKIMKTDLTYKSNMETLEAFEKEERELRTKLVDLVQSASEMRNYSRINDEYVSITYKGKEVASELSQRIGRVRRMDLRAFISEMDRIKSHFKMTSKKAHDILKKISPEFPEMDEIHLRSASVGLAAKAGKPSKTSQLFIRAYKDIHKRLGGTSFFNVYGKEKQGSPAIVTLAESLTIIAKDESELDRLVATSIEVYGKPWSRRFDVEDRLRAVSVLMSQKGDTDALVDIANRISGSYCPGSLGAAAYLATLYRTRSSGGSWFKRGLSSLEEDGGDIICDKYYRLYEEISRLDSKVMDNSMAAALLCSATIPDEEVIARYMKAKKMLDNFNIGSMMIPSAMVAILPQEVEESLDNLRLASSSISLNSLSLGGIENMSLGMKILMHSAIMPVGPQAKRFEAVTPATAASVQAAPSVLGLTGISIAGGMALTAGILTFHEFSLHKMAVRDYAFHPVHSHYIYG